MSFLSSKKASYGAEHSFLYFILFSFDLDIGILNISTSHIEYMWCCRHTLELWKWIYQLELLVYFYLWKVHVWVFRVTFRYLQIGRVVQEVQLSWLPVIASNSYRLLRVWWILNWLFIVEKHIVQIVKFDAFGAFPSAYLTFWFRAWVNLIFLLLSLWTLCFLSMLDIQVFCVALAHGKFNFLQGIYTQFVYHTLSLVAF